MLQSIGSQRVRHDLVSEQQQRYQDSFLRPSQVILQLKASTEQAETVWSETFRLLRRPRGGVSSLLSKPLEHSKGRAGCD